MCLEDRTSSTPVPPLTRTAERDVSPSVLCPAQRQFGVDGRGGYGRQMQRAMETAVSRGLMSPVDFHRRKADMMEMLSSGVDDGATRTPSKPPSRSRACLGLSRSPMLGVLARSPLSPVSRCGEDAV